MDINQRFKKLSPLLVIMAGACWGLIGIFSKHLAEAGFSPIQTVFLRFGISEILIWLYILVFDRGKMRIRFKDIWMFLGTGICSLVLFSTLYFTTIQLATLSLAAVLAFSEPFVSTLAGLLFFRQRLTLGGAAGILLIFASIIILNIKKRKETT